MFLTDFSIEFQFSEKMTHRRQFFSKSSDWFWNSRKTHQSIWIHCFCTLWNIVLFLCVSCTWAKWCLQIEVDRMCCMIEIALEGMRFILWRFHGEEHYQFLGWGYLCCLHQDLHRLLFCLLWSLYCIPILLILFIWQCLKSSSCRMLLKICRRRHWKQ